MTDQIPGGHFLMSRKVFNSTIWKKPPQYYRLLSWLIGKAVFRDGHTFKGHVLKRGELITTYGEIADALSYRLNRAIKKPTLKEIRIMLSWLQSESMIFMKPLTGGTLPNKGRPKDLTRAYIGLLIFVINYDTYQDSKSYKGRHKGRPTDEQGQLEEEGKEECIKTPRGFSSDISALINRYPDQETIKQAFQAISSTRKSNRIADTVKLSILKSWERYPVESVMAGMITYIEKGYHDQGKGEKYLLGIIRNIKPADSLSVPGMKSTGSHALDEHYRSQGVRII
ncbi:MAG: hypothetical protein WCH07_04375 [Deltaproteobacteria bacterium]